MSIRSLAAIAALMFVSLVSIPVSNAQDDPNAGRGRGGPGGGPGGGGRGGFGGGFGGMTRTPDTEMVRLLREETVRKEIEITPDQEGLLTKLNEKQRSERPQINMRDASDEDRQKAMETMAKQAVEAKEKVEEILDPAQIERLEQLTVQSLGINGLISSPELAKKVGLTTEQVDKMKAEATANGEAMRAKMGEIFQSDDRDAARAKMQELRKEQDGKLVAMLDETQKAEYEKLKGKLFEFPEMGRGGFGGPGGGPGGGRGQGGPGGDRPGGDRPGGDRPAGGRPAAE